MKEANPRIFRSLETAAGSAGFDTIVAAAVASYGAVRHPSEAKARDFANLVLPAWDRLKPETRRALGAALCHSANVPRGIVEKLLAEPIEVAAPFLLSSPVLTEADRRFLAESRDSRLRRLARETASTKAPSVETFETETAAEKTVASAIPAAPDVIAPHAADTPEAEESSTVAAGDKPRYRAGMAAAAVRDALRSMVRTGRNSALAAPTPADLVRAAVDGDVAATLAVLATLAELDEATLGLVAEDEGGERLAVALKAIGMRDADALTVLMMLKPRIGLDVTAFDLMTRYYRSLRREDCAALIGLRRRIQAPALVPIFEDIERFERPASRAAFGRRTERPEPKSREA